MILLAKASKTPADSGTAGGEELGVMRSAPMSKSRRRSDSLRCFRNGKARTTFNRAERNNMSTRPGRRPHPMCCSRLDANEPVKRITQLDGRLW